MDPRTTRDLSPVSIVPDRYAGTYSRIAGTFSRHCRWVAFPCDPWAVPKEPFDGDNIALDWWTQNAVPVGGGASPGEAFDDLVSRLIAVEPDHVYGPNPGDGSFMWTWQLHWHDGRDSLIDSMFESGPWTKV